ncbi:MAG: alpha-E domain-containing protein [Pseudomonadota bacterium]
MLGKTAGGLFWMFRYLERSENTARLVESGFRMALTSGADSEDEWVSVVTTAGLYKAFAETERPQDAPSIVNFLLRDRSNPSSVMSVIEAARNNARLVRTALTREVWEAVNECWITLKDALSGPVRETELPALLGTIRQQSALVRGALHGTMLRNDIYNFTRVGSFIERADNTARIVDVKYYVLLPSVSFVGSSLDNVQWESILRSASGERAFRWLYEEDINPARIVDFLILDRRMPRSLAFCYEKIVRNLDYLCADYELETPSIQMAKSILNRLSTSTIETVFDYGLHEYVQSLIHDNARLAEQFERDYRFTE